MTEFAKRFISHAILRNLIQINKSLGTGRQVWRRTLAGFVTSFLQETLPCNPSPPPHAPIRTARSG
jgi:hypothetical protein